jgi:hypothetical protein
MTGNSGQRLTPKTRKPSKARRGQRLTPKTNKLSKAQKGEPVHNCKYPECGKVSLRGAIIVGIIFNFSRPSHERNISGLAVPAPHRAVRTCLTNRR